MKIFKLPDLGEGLPDAQIREWYVKPGDEVAVDQPLAAMETAKALVDVPAPYAGKINKLFGDEGDTIETGEPLIGFEGESEKDATTQDAGTVVGAIEASDTVLKEPATGVASTATAPQRIKATPAVRMLAKQLNVDLAALAASGQPITAESVKAAAQQSPAKSLLSGETQPLSPVRRAMVMSMTQSHQSIVPVTLVDDADITAWNDNQDFSVRLLRAMQAACSQEPILNSYFDGNNMATQTNQDVNVGLAVDTAEGLFVPVIKAVGAKTDTELRAAINQYKSQAQSKSIPQADLHGATIMLSNFGSLAGRYANPIIIAPMVAIVGVGKSRQSVLPIAGELKVRTILPLSLTVDHRAVTGGEAARFLKALMTELNKPSV